MDRGPVLSRTLNLINEGGRPGESTMWEQCIAPPSIYEVTLIQDCGTDQLSEAEESLLNEVFDQFGHKTRWELVDHVHTLPEWTDPKGSAVPISYRDILAGEGRTEAEIAEIENELAELALLDAIL